MHSPINGFESHSSGESDHEQIHIPSVRVSVIFEARVLSVDISPAKRCKNIISYEILLSEYE